LVATATSNNKKNIFSAVPKYKVREAIRYTLKHGLSLEAFRKRFPLLNDQIWFNIGDTQNPDEPNRKSQFTYEDLTGSLFSQCPARYHRYGQTARHSRPSIYDVYLTTQFTLAAIFAGICGIPNNMNSILVGSGQVVNLNGESLALPATDNLGRMMIGGKVAKRHVPQQVFGPLLAELPKWRLHTDQVAIHRGPLTHPCGKYDTELLWMQKARNEAVGPIAPCGYAIAEEIVHWRNFFNPPNIEPNDILMEILYKKFGIEE
jgi:hypothetical protein